MAVNKALGSKPFYEVKSESDTTLVFDSLFESGEHVWAHVLFLPVSLYACVSTNRVTVNVCVLLCNWNVIQDSQCWSPAAGCNGVL